MHDESTFKKYMYNIITNLKFHTKQFTSVILCMNVFSNNVADMLL